MKVLATAKPSEFLLSLSNQLDFEVTHERESELMLEWANDSLWLLDGAAKQHPVRVDFISDWQKLKIGKEDLLGKAVGVRRGLNAVVDVTGGWGQDTLRLLKIGCEVTTIERSPVLYALLLDGGRRAEVDERWRNGGGRRWKLIHGDASDILPDLSSDQRQVIFMDPMFPERKKGALAKGEMQLLQKLLPEEEPAQELWETAWRYTERRLVYKSPRLTPVLARAPDLKFEGRAIRYDVWLRS